MGFEDGSPYRFRPVTAADFPLLARWRAMPHVVEWWTPLEDESMAEMLDDPDLAAWIVEHRGRPFAYAQDYGPHATEGHPFASLPPGSRGIDQFIGEPDMVGHGHGSAYVRLHCERLFAAGAPAVGTDPHPGNARAVRAYQKAGFRIVSGPLDTAWGRVVLMENRRGA